ncbi:MAG TPA: hypothetical protein VEM57_07080 [Candidatus Binatus sp.]|nr:hypothetical protein [Candidatus Binatus sp.]
MTRRALGPVAPVVIVGALVVLGVARHSSGADPVDLVVTPPAARLSVRVGETVRFSATTDGEVTWSIWSRPVSHERAWSYVPGPEEAGWQHVTLTVVGSGGSRFERMWDVGVVPLLRPALVEVLPPQGAVTVEPGERLRFRCGARTSAARPADRLRFDWTLDGRPVHRDEGPATAARSELLLPEADAGPHRLAVSVAEDGGMASLAEWTVDVAATRPISLPPPTLVPRGPRRVTAAVGERLVFDAEVSPEPPRARYDWALDGRRAQRGPAARYEYAAAAPGRHRISVAVSAGRKSVTWDTWLLVVDPLR